jgi:hypothetical protein
MTIAANICRGWWKLVGLQVACFGDYSSAYAYAAVSSLGDLILDPFQAVWTITATVLVSQSSLADYLQGCLRNPPLCFSPSCIVSSDRERNFRKRVRENLSWFRKTWHFF